MLGPVGEDDVLADESGLSGLLEFRHKGLDGVRSHTGVEGYSADSYLVYAGDIGKRIREKVHVQELAFS